MSALPQSIRSLSPAWLWLLPALALLVPLFLFPLLLILRYSFNLDTDSGLFVETFSFANYVKIVTDPFYIRVFLNSLWVAAGVSLACLALGFPFAWFLVRWSRRSRVILLWAIYTPLIVSVIVRVYGWMVVTSDFGVINSIAMSIGLTDKPWKILYETEGMWIGLVHRYLPLAVLPLVNALAKIDLTLTQAARNLGATPRRAFWTLVVPLMLPGFVAGFQLVLANVLSDFVIPTLMGTTRFQMIAPAIYNEAMGRVNWAMAAAMAVMVLVIMGALLASTNILLRRLAPWARSV